MPKEERYRNRWIGKPPQEDDDEFGRGFSDKKKIDALWDDYNFRTRKIEERGHMYRLYAVWISGASLVATVFLALLGLLPRPK